MIKLILILIQMQLIQILTLQTLTLLLKLKMINPSHLQHVTAKHKAVANTPTPSLTNKSSMPKLLGRMPSNSQKSPNQNKDMEDDNLYLDQRQTSDQVYEL